MVGGLIQKQDVGVSEKCLGQKYADLEVILDFLHELVVKGCGNSETVEHLSCLTFRFPAAHLGELALKLSCPDAVFLSEVSLLVDLVTLLHDGIELLISHDDRVDYPMAVESKVILSQGCHSLTRSDDDLSRIRFDLTGKNLQER